MTLRRVGLSNSLSNQSRFAGRKVTLSRVSLRRFPFPSAPTAVVNYIEDVFSTYLYTGTGKGQVITNNIGIGGSYGGSVYFDGTGDYLTVPANAAFNFGTGDFTIEFWYYPGAVNGARTLLDINYGTAPNFTLQPSSGVMLLYYNGGNTIVSSETDTAGSWYHYAIVRSGSTITMYRNGTSVGTATYSGNVGNSSVSCFIGGSLGGSGFYIDGYLSNFRIVKGTAVYASAFTPSTVPLTAISGTSLLTCQSPSPTTDYSTNAFTITVTNAIAQNGGGPFIDSSANKGGLVWCKSRTQATSHGLFDTDRGANRRMSTNGTVASSLDSNSLTTFNSNGFSVGSDPAGTCNTNGDNYVSWTFRKQAKFFDVVTYTGNGSSIRAIPHNLGSVPGCIIVKRTDAAGHNWCVYHRSLPNNNTYNLFLNTTDAQGSDDNMILSFSPYLPTSTEFYVAYAAGATAGRVNFPGATYVAYVFAHDAGGFGPAGTDNVITCGSFTPSSGAATVTLGYEPQFVILKNASAAEDWITLDTMRGWVATAGGERVLNPNTSAAESGGNLGNPTATGFETANLGTGTYIYIAIRRGPMKTPTSGTDVFAPVTATVSSNINVTTNFPVDLSIGLQRSHTEISGNYFFDRLRGSGNYLTSTATSGENSTSTTTSFNSSMNSYVDNYSNPVFGETTAYGGNVYWNFRRAPGFFDVVYYTGFGSGSDTANITHNLGVAPEMVIYKSRNNISQWVVRGTFGFIVLNGSDARLSSTPLPATATTFQASASGNAQLSQYQSGYTYVAYLFATCPGVSKVGSYTGTGTTQQVDCGFAAGARFVLIKRSDSTGNWYVWDSARGIIAGNDPYVLINTADAEVTNTDYIDPYSLGFEISSTAPAAINANGGTYIFLAIA